MSVISLHDAAFNTIVRQKWKNTLLHNLLVDAKYEIMAANSPGRTGQYLGSANQKRFKFAQLVLVICKQIIKNDFLPDHIKKNLASAFFEIAFEIEQFLETLVKIFTKFDKKNINYLLKCIIISQHGVIDEKNSVLKIIADSKFAYKFSNKNLIWNCVEYSDLEKLVPEVIAKVKAQPKWKKTIGPIVKDLNVSLNSMIYPTVDVYIKSQIALKDIRANFTKAVLHGKNMNIINFIYKNEKATEKDDFILRLSYYAFKDDMLFCPSLAVFFYENMDELAWQDILRRNFNKVFWIVLSSYRCRRYMMTWFRQAIPTMSCDTYIEMISNISWNSPCLIPHEQENMEKLFKQIWDETPDKFKDEHQIRQAVIKTIVHIIEKVQLLEYVLKGYNKSIQVHMLKQSILHYLISRSDDDLPEVELFREQLIRVRVNLDLPESALEGAGIEDWKEHILEMDGCRAYRIGAKRQIIARVFKIHECGFKPILLESSGFMEMFLLKHWRKKTIRHIFMEFTDFSNHGCHQYFLGFDEKILERVYEKVLLEDGDINIADEGLATLQIDTSTAWLIKSIVLSKPMVRKHLLKTYFRNGFFGFAEQWHFYYYHMDIHRFLQELFATDGKEALWDLILYIEGSLTIMQQIDHLNLYTVFCFTIVYRYSLGERLRESLMRDGHPNLRNATITYQGRAPTPHELPVLRKVVDFRYRSFLALLYGANPSILANHRVETVTDASQILAQDVNLIIPVVL